MEFLLVTVFLVLSPVAVVTADQGTKPWLGSVFVALSFTCFFVIVLVGLYIRWCTNAFLGGGATHSHHQTKAAQGLDVEAIAKLPSVRLSDIKKHLIQQGGIECSVCLHEFKEDDDNDDEEEEMLCLLPECCHVFHSHCIKLWLASHATCPVCRANLENSGHGSSETASMCYKSDRVANGPPETLDANGDYHTVEIEELDQSGTQCTNLSNIMPKEISPKSDYREDKANLNRCGCFTTISTSPKSKPCVLR